MMVCKKVKEVRILHKGILFCFSGRNVNSRGIVEMNYRDNCMVSPGAPRHTITT